jgi:6-phosphogluconolactonase (cycloisomerase 2 family)
MTLRIGPSTPAKLYLGSTAISRAYVGATQIFGEWTPAQLGADLALWLDADDASTITLNSSDVSQWDDKSGNGYDLLQSTAADQPAYVTGGLNGKPVLRNNGGDFLASPTTSLFRNVSTATWVAVGKYTSSPWDVSSASYIQNFSVAAQENTPTGIFFKPDGTKMYVIGTVGDDVNEYDLSTPWDVSSTSYLQNFSIAAQETGPRGLFFKPDGTKMYVIGIVKDDVNEYDLSTPWDVSSASYLQNFSVAVQETVPTGFTFKPDGTKMYVVGFNGRAVNEYDLSTPWDVSSASYLQNFSVAVQETGPQGLFFKPDGTKMYVIGDSGDDVNEYDLSTPWDVSSASYLQNFSVAVQETGPQGLFFKPDGTKMYVIGVNGRDVNEYDLVDIGNTNGMLLFCSTGSDGTSSRLGLTSNPSGGGAFMSIAGRRLDADAFAAAPSSTARIVDTWFLEVGQADYANAQANHWTNGTQDLTGAAFQTAGNTSDTNPLSVNVFGPPLAAAGAEIAEAIAIEGTLSSDDRQKLEGYLAHKWGLTANLPVDHPYKTTPPTV